MSPSHGSHALSVSFPSFLTPQGYLGPAGVPTQPSSVYPMAMERVNLAAPKAQSIPLPSPAPGEERAGR